MKKNKTQSISKEEKKAIKARNKEIERLNKSLIPVSKKTAASLPFVSFEAKGVLRLKDSRWIKIYYLSDMNISSEEKENLIKQICNGISSKIRITSFFNNQTRKDFLTITVFGEVYSDVKEIIEKEELELQRAFSSVGVDMKEININEEMQQIHRNFNINTSDDFSFEYASSIKSKKDWKEECFKPLTKVDSDYMLGELFISGYFVIQYPEEISGQLLQDLKESGYSFATAVDIRPMSDEDILAYNDILSLNYNRNIDKNNLEQKVNFSYMFFLFRDSENLIQDNIFLEFSNNNISISSAQINTTEIFESISSLNLMNYQVMRSVNPPIISKFIL